MLTRGLFVALLEIVTTPSKLPAEVEEKISA
jgi:hypothetical protein